jgi:PEP-CTERM motif
VSNQLAILFIYWEFKLKLFKSFALAVLFSVVSASASATDILTTLSVPSLPASLGYSQTHSETIGTVFWDDYYFTIPAGFANSVTSTITAGSALDLSNLQARLYMGNTHETATVAPGTLLSAWGTTVIYSPTVSATTVVLNPLSLAAGTYTLQIRGTVSGSSGGSYAGVLNLTNPVPEPETYAMMLAGLGLMGFMSRRRKTS